MLSNDNWSGGGTFTVTANLWWGTNATSYTFYENGVAVGQGNLIASTPNAQSATLKVTAKAKGTYVYRVDRERCRRRAGQPDREHAQCTVSNTQGHGEGQGHLRVPGR
ncbi:hypothetical protein AB4Z22_46605, partial [Paenibacillus sp. TAF58]